jgi:DUF1009 family protein
MTPTNKPPATDWLAADRPEDRTGPSGLIAGWGRYPVVIARRLKQHGHRVCCLGVKDHADPELAAICDVYYTMGVAQLGRAIRVFRREGVRRATMAGKIHKVILFHRWSLLKHIPDWTAICTFFPHYITRQLDRKDDTMLETVVRAFGRFGIQFQPATDFAPDLLVRNGHLAGPIPSPAVQHDISFAWQIARQLGRVDVGQTVVVKGRAVLAVEAVEGTDQCIRRAGQLCPSGGFTVVKVAKPQQDMRYDVPTIGMGTMRALMQSGGRALAIEAGRTILLDESDVLDFARRHSITLVALDKDTVAELKAA